MDRKYPSDLSDGQWQLVKDLFPAISRVGRPPLDRRWVLDAILYVVRTGCQWRLLPADFPCWQSVYTVFRRWRISGVWDRIHSILRCRCRIAMGKRRKPTVSIVDSQSVRTAEGGLHRGYDAGKKVTGRKRHLAVDSLGLIWALMVQPASWQDHLGAVPLLARLYLSCPRLKVLFADAAYARGGLPEWLKRTFRWVLQPVLRSIRVRRFVVLPKRWIVERTFAWIIRHRRHARDYERKPENSEALIHIAMIGIMLRRLENSI